MATYCLKKHICIGCDSNRKFFPAERLFKEYQFPKKQVETDDIIDAAVLAITGILGLQNGFKSIPENPATDSLGLEMKMMVASEGCDKYAKA